MTGSSGSNLPTSIWDRLSILLSGLAVMTPKNRQIARDSGLRKWVSVIPKMVMRVNGDRPLGCEGTSIPLSLT